jgi:hypothetical protein
MEIEALSLRMELLRQGPRENLLLGPTRQKLVDALKPFAGQRIDIRHSAAAFEVNGAVVSATPVGEDALGLAYALIGVLKDAGWNSPPTPLIGSLGQGIDVITVHNASPETLRAAAALVRSLQAIPLAVTGPEQVEEDRAKRVGKDESLPAFDDNTIVLEVRSHP